MDILETQRLYLRTWDAAADLERARSLWGDPEVMTFLGGALGTDAIRAKLDSEIACQEKHGIQYWPIFEKQTAEFVGCCGLRPWHYSPPEGYEMGFHLLKNRWGKGFSLEVARGVIRHGFESLRFSTLRAGHHPEHVRSRDILIKLGFQFVDAVFYKPTGLMHPTYQLSTARGPDSLH